MDVISPSWLSRRGTVGLAAVALFLAAPDAPARKGKIAVEKIAYKGWDNNLRLSNGDAELIVTLDVGPRILSYRTKDGKNVFKEYQDQLGKSGEKEWMIRGGHRLWLAPEDLTRTYFPDNGPVAYKQTGARTVRFTPAEEKEYGIQKELDVQLAETGTVVTVVHRVRNTGSNPTEFSIWALTVMAPGGIEIIPLPPKKPHPGSPKNAKSPREFWNNQNISLWPFFDFKDPRWNFGSKYITLRHDKTKGPTKIGLAHRQEWIAYLNEGTLFVKRIPFLEDKTFPDGGVNFETFTNEDMLEVESLGPLVKLAPGEAAEWTEHWELLTGVPDVKDENDIDQHVAAKLKAK